MDDDKEGTCIMAADSEPTNPVYSNTDDYDLANLLFVQNIPSALDKYQEALQANVKSINQWLAWELTRAEGAVAGKLKAGELPKDDTIASKFKRTGYRAKVIDTLRSGAPWISVIGIDTRTLSITATEDKIHLAILHGVLGIGQSSNSAQFLNILKVSSTGIHDTPGIVQPHSIHFVDHVVDSARQVILPVVKTFTFNMIIAEAERPPPMEGEKKAREGREFEKKTYDATINTVTFSANFDMELWNKQKPKDEEAYAIGKKALLQRQLTLLEPAF